MKGIAALVPSPFSDMAMTLTLHVTPGPRGQSPRNHQWGIAVRPGPRNLAWLKFVFVFVLFFSAAFPCMLLSLAGTAVEGDLAFNVT